MIVVYLARIISDVRKELNSIGFMKNGNLEVLKIKDDIFVLLLENMDNSYIVKYYQKGVDRELLKEKMQLASYGVDAGIVLYTDKIVVLENFVKNEVYDIVKIEDLKNEEVIKILARWIKKIHGIKDLNFKNYKDYFCLSNINYMIEKFKLKSNSFLKYILNNFHNIKLKLDRSIKGVCCNRVELENIVISKEKTDVFVNNMEDFCYGFVANDIDAMMDLLDGNGRKIFLDEYGKVEEIECLLNEVVGCVIALIIASKESEFPSWCSKYFNLINGDKIRDKARLLVEWY